MTNEKTYDVLAINPGSTSTKIALYRNDEEVFSESIEHSDKEIAAHQGLKKQFEMRRDLIFSLLEEKGVSLDQLSAVVGRGGLLPPIKAGGYYVNDDMKRRIIHGPITYHASNLGALLAAAIADKTGIPALIYDAVSANELKPVAEVTGFPEIKRESFCHVLNSKAAGRKASDKTGKSYGDSNYIVAHLGGGISISAHEKGRIVDSISDDAGPFSPERAGSIPLLYVIDMCYSGEYNKKEVTKKIRGMGGLKAYFGTHDCRKIEEMIDAGDEKAALVYDAEAYQIAKGIGQMAPTIDGVIDGIILTGGLAYSDMLTDMIRKRVEFIAPVITIPGENELESLALGAGRILRGEELCSEYVDRKPAKEELFV